MSNINTPLNLFDASTFDKLGEVCVNKHAGHENSESDIFAKELNDAMNNAGAWASSRFAEA
jgi:hypothetical protein